MGCPPPGDLPNPGIKPGSPVLQTQYTVLAAKSEKAMTPNFSTLAWKIPWTEEPGGLQSMGLLRVGRD